VAQPKASTWTTVAAVVAATTARMFRRRHRIGTVTRRKTGSMSHELLSTGWASDGSSGAAATFMYIRNAPAALNRAAST
jgi:hypothetical protein